MKPYEPEANYVEVMTKVCTYESVQFALHKWIRRVVQAETIMWRGVALDPIKVIRLLNALNKVEEQCESKETPTNESSSQ